MGVEGLRVEGTGHCNETAFSVRWQEVLENTWAVQPLLFNTDLGPGFRVGGLGVFLVLGEDWGSGSP